MAEKLKKTRWHSCNVLRVAAEGRHLWQFDARNGGFSLNREQTSFPGEPLPPGTVRKDWRAIFQPKLNVACLSPENVFLRVAQLPRSAFSEMLNMVELQLEKFSPIPVTQIVWSLHVLPGAEGNMQTVVVMIVARSVVEEFLGKLEGDGYMADRLELPMLDQLQATRVHGEGAWVYPEAPGAKNSAMVAWWYGGALQSLDLITLPPGDRVAHLKEQLKQMAWAGELEGWLKSPPRWHLVAEPGTAEEWSGLLRQAVDQPVETLAPTPAPQLAALTAKRAAEADPKAGLLPPEFTARYQQQFVDRLWMRGLLAVALLYGFGFFIYAIAVGFASYKTSQVEARVSALSNSYTNAIQDRARLRILKDRQELKYAALDCWKAVADNMPEDVLSLDSLSLSEGKRLDLNGRATSGHAQDVLNFQAALRNATNNDQPIFEPEVLDNNTHVNPDGSVTWGFRLALKRTEIR